MGLGVVALSGPALRCIQTRSPVEFPTMGTWPITVYFDGDCPMCLREVAWLQRRDRQGRVVAVDIAAADFDPAPTGRTLDALMASLHVQLADGRWVDGVESFRQLYRAVGLGWIVAPTGWPVLRTAFDAAYRAFARRRVRIGQLLGRPSCEGGSCGVSGGRRASPER